jgi:hypothetical protein
MRSTPIGLMLVAAVACQGGGRQTPAQPTSPALGTPPLAVYSDLFVCPGGFSVAAYGDVFYLPNDPFGPSANVRPDRCFATTAEARQAGFHLPPPPPGGTIIGDLYLVPPDPPVTPTCEAAARRLEFTVLCPTLAPAPSNSLADCFQDGCVVFRAFVLQFSFAGPPGYVGIPGQNGNHLFVFESRAGRESEVEFLTCLEGQAVGDIAVRGAAGRWVDCPANGSGMNSGHVLLVWQEGGIRYGVSLHSDTELNRQIALAVAQRLMPVSP